VSTTTMATSNNTTVITTFCSMNKNDNAFSGFDFVISLKSETDR
jgi:hypothetical protein